MGKGTVKINIKLSSENKRRKDQTSIKWSKQAENLADLWDSEHYV